MGWTLWSHHLSEERVGRACARELIAHEEEKKQEARRNEIIKERISEDEASNEIQKQFYDLMRTLGLSCEYFQGHGLKLMCYGDKNDTLKQLYSINENIRSYPSMIMSSVYSNEELEKRSKRGDIMATELLHWRKAFPNTTKVLECDFNNEFNS